MRNDAKYCSEYCEKVLNAFLKDGTRPRAGVSDEESERSLRRRVGDEDPPIYQAGSPTQILRRTLNSTNCRGSVSQFFFYVVQSS